MSATRDLFLASALLLMAAAVQAAGDNTVLYCNDLRFTRVAEQILMKGGVKGFSHLEGGFTAWTREGLPVEQSLP